MIASFSEKLLLVLALNTVPTVSNEKFKPKQEDESEKNLKKKKVFM